MITDISMQPTPMLRQQILVRRGSRTVRGTVIGIRKYPLTFWHLPTEIIEEVQFRETPENVVVPFPQRWAATTPFSK